MLREKRIRSRYDVILEARNVMMHTNSYFFFFCRTIFMWWIIFSHWHNNGNPRIGYTIDTRAIFVSDQSMQSYCIGAISRSSATEGFVARVTRGIGHVGTLHDARENRNSVLALHALQAERWLMPRFSYLAYHLGSRATCIAAYKSRRYPPCVILRAADIYLAASNFLC